MGPFQCLTTRICSIIAHSTVPEDPTHAENTLAWLLKLNDGADESLRIAALGHDIERAMESRRVRKSDFADFEQFKEAHAGNSALILREIMDECDVEQRVSDEVHRLVCLHETGGDSRSNLLQDADSLSFFENNLPYYFQRNGYEGTLRRAVWGYRRLSLEGQEIVNSFQHGSPELDRMLRQIVKIFHMR